MRRVKNNLKMGVVGLPNVGKSSLFNLLCEQACAAVRGKLSALLESEKCSHSWRLPVCRRTVRPAQRVPPARHTQRSSSQCDTDARRPLLFCRPVLYY